MNKVITREDEEKYLKFKIFDNKIFDKNLSYDEIISLIENKKIMLEVSDDDGTEVLTEEQYNEIKKTIPYIMKILNKPRSFITTKEEGIPVETAKRINYKAMVELGKNSKDWHARTITSVKPKNILTDINEETIDLYENRFICSLIDRISKLVSDRKKSYEQEKATAEEEKDTKIIDSYYYNYQTQSLLFYEMIKKSTNNEENENEYIKKIDKVLEDIESTERKIRNLKMSSFYKILKHKKKVSNPIKKTNIFIFDVNYNKAYKLWNYLNTYHEEKRLEPKLECEEGELQHAYYMYNVLCIFAALHDMGYTEKMGYNINLKTPNIPKLEFLNEKKIINLWCTNMEIHMSYNYEKNKSDEFVIMPNIINFEDKNTTFILKETESMLEKASYREKFSPISSQYIFVDLNFRRNDNTTILPEKICKRFYSIGNAYSSEEKTEDLEKWGNYKTGIQIISPIKLRTNFLRIEKIINYHIIKHEKIDAQTCPLCQSNYYKKRGYNDYECNSCKHKISYTYCNSCDKDHKKPILWVEYKDRKFLESKDVIDGNFKERRTFDKMEKIEVIMGEKAITSFELENENTEWKLKTICPNCGKQLGK